MIPERIKIGGYIYRCQYNDKLARDAERMGDSCGNALEINLDSTVPLQNQQSTIIHEIIEQINFRYHLNLEHSQITILESALYQVIQDNLAVMEFIMKKNICE